MNLSQIGELSLLEVIRKRFRGRAEGLILGIGDDAAVIRSGGLSVVTTDMMVEGVHFDLAWTTPFQLGFKLISVNISDIYAMGGTPRYVLLNFAADKSCTMQFFGRFLDGVESALNTYSVALVGGDISAADRIMLSVTAIGSARRVVQRRGAVVGDRVYVSGPLGDAACGLEVLRKVGHTIDLEKGVRRGFPFSWETVAPLLRRTLMPVARDPSAIREKATAMIDISDGLLIDLGRLCRESGVGAKIRLQDIPVSAAMKEVASRLGLSAAALALGGGDDYELLFTASPKRKVDAVCIGEITRSGVTVVDADGRRVKVPEKGYQHFSVQG
jgi:thiamine-monophosphate kinase